MENAKVNPTFKAGDKKNVNDYRPFSILPTLSKIIEKWTESKKYVKFKKHTFLHEYKVDFEQNHSTESALILMKDTWLKSISDGKLVGCTMIDFLKAFDFVDH